MGFAVKVLHLAAELIYSEFMGSYVLLVCYCMRDIVSVIRSLNPFEDNVEVLKGIDRYRYYVKKTSSYEKALEFQQEVRKTVKDCFVIAVYKGKQISVAEARKLE